jgi:hypothetical protein
MIDEQWIALGRIALRCKGWRWMEGMAWRVPPHIAPYCPHSEGRYPFPDGPVAPVPDFRDPATMGCLLALVREALGNPLLYVEADMDDAGGISWHVWDAQARCSLSGGPHGYEAVALVTTLEVAE